MSSAKMMINFKKGAYAGLSQDSDPHPGFMQTGGENERIV
jgi:hypothetical protein